MICTFILERKAANVLLTKREREEIYDAVLISTTITIYITIKSTRQ